MHACMFAGLARTLFMEQRALFGPTIDLQVGAGLPSTAQLAHMACSSGEFAVAFRNGRAFGLRMVPSATAVPRSVALDAGQSSVVSGGTKVGPSGKAQPTTQPGYSLKNLFVPISCLDYVHELLRSALWNFCLKKVTAKRAQQDLDMSIFETVRDRWGWRRM